MKLEWEDGHWWFAQVGCQHALVAPALLVSTTPYEVPRLSFCEMASGAFLV